MARHVFVGVTFFKFALPPSPRGIQHNLSHLRRICGAADDKILSTSLLSAQIIFLIIAGYMKRLERVNTEKSVDRAKWAVARRIMKKRLLG